MREKPIRTNWRGGATAATVAALLLGSISSCGYGESGLAATAAVAAALERTSIVAMGRLEPNGRVIRAGAASDDIIREILVEDGAEVAKGQILVKLDGHELRLAEREAAELSVERAELTPFRIEAQRAVVRLQKAELAHAQADVAGQRGLIDKGFTPGKDFEDAQLRVRRQEEALAQERAELDRLVASLALELKEAANELRRAESELERALIRAPIDGRVLKVLQRAGERTAGRPVLHLGNTSEMYALAEVHATDIRYVKTGQRARFESSALPGPIEGRVEQVGSMIYTNNIFGEDPGAPAGVRVFQVHVRLDDSTVASRFTNLEGQVRIFVDGAGSS